MIDDDILASLNEKLSNRLTVVYKPWESGIFKRMVFNLQWSEETNSSQNASSVEKYLLLLQSIDQELSKTRPLMMASRVASNNQNAIWSLERAGFLLIECYIVLDHKLQNIPSRKSSATIRPVDENDIDDLDELAYNSFLYSRFHVDSNIPTDLARRSRAEWVKNAVRDPHKDVFVLVDSDQVAGFVIAKPKRSDKDNMCQLDLIAVHPSFQGKGYGYDLTIFFLNWCKEHQFSRSLVGTQGQNIPSLRLYEACGFKVYQTYFSFHKHSI